MGSRCHIGNRFKAIAIQAYPELSRGVFGNLYFLNGLWNPLPHKFKNRLAPRIRYNHFISTGAAIFGFFLFAKKVIKKIEVSKYTTGT